MSEAKRGRGRPRKIPPSNNPSINGNNGHDCVRSVEEISHRSDLPEFFQIYVPALCSNALRMPSDFPKIFGDKIPSNVTLRVLSGMSWQVHIHQVLDKWFFQKGWPEFVVENSIEDGDFMTFCYTGNYEFFVKVYGINGCMKRNAGMIDVEPVEIVEDAEESESESDDHIADTVKCESPECLTRSKTVCRNPSFSVEVKEYHLRKMCLSVPQSFLRSYSNRVKTRSVRKGIEKATATLWHKQKSWEVGLHMVGSNHRITEGLSKFARDNSLRAGDVCRFELIDAVNLSFKISISK